jgi:glutathione S-transferase
MADKVKLHRCPFTFVKLSGHPCHKVQKALDDQGIPYEVVKHGRDRSQVEELTGQRKLPFLEMPGGEVYRAESKEMAERIRAGSIATG